MRRRTARGTLVNAAFSSGLAGVGLLRQLAISIFLTASEFGFWGLILISVMTLLWFKDVGVSDKFIQQDEPDQELAFQKAFTLNLAWTGVFFVLILAAIPVFALLYGRSDVIVPGVVLSLVVLGSALQSPTWIFYREMRFARQRALIAVDPVVSLVVTVALGVVGAGYGSLIIGGVTGSWLAAAAALRASPVSHPAALGPARCARLLLLLVAPLRGHGEPGHGGAGRGVREQSGGGPGRPGRDRAGQLGDAVRRPGGTRCSRRPSIPRYAPSETKRTCCSRPSPSPTGWR